MTAHPGDARAGSGPADAPAIRALTRARRVTLELSDQLLTHLPDVGDLAVQRPLDDWVDQAADTLRALSEALEERLLSVATGVGTTPPVEPGSTPEAARRVGLP